MSNDTETTVATRPQTPPATLQQRLESPTVQLELSNVLPKGVTLERFKKSLLLATRKNQKLAQCSWQSFYAAAVQSALFGVVPDGRNGHLVPFWNKKTNSYDAEFMWDWKGLCLLAMRSGKLLGLPVLEHVCRDDVFRYGKGEIIEHTIDFSQPRGPAYAVYSLVKLADGTESACVMTIEETDEVRKRSRSPDDGPWATDRGQMQLKTVFKRHSKRMDISEDFEAAVNHDNRISGGSDLTVEVAPRTPLARQLNPSTDADVPATPDDGSPEAPVAQESQAEQSQQPAAAAPALGSAQAARRGPGRPPIAARAAQTTPAAPQASKPAPVQLNPAQTAIAAWLAKHNVSWEEFRTMGQTLGVLPTPAPLVISGIGPEHCKLILDPQFGPAILEEIVKARAEDKAEDTSPV